jgi:hypothetical protein
MTARFVWTPSLTGPRPEIWHTGIFTVNMIGVKPLQSYDITDEEAQLPLKVLARLYPLVEKVEG